MSNKTIITESCFTSFKQITRWRQHHACAWPTKSASAYCTITQRRLGLFFASSYFIQKYFMKSFNLLL
jgi:hypothetical protein